jgi:hypothetical protein
VGEAGVVGELASRTNPGEGDDRAKATFSKRSTNALLREKSLLLFHIH